MALVQNGNIVLNMQTDDQGNYTFDVLQSGTYRLEATSGDLFFPALSSVVVSSTSWSAAGLA